MNESNYSEVFFQSLQAMGRTLMTALPAIFAALIVLGIGWVIARLLGQLAERLLHLVKIDRMASRYGLDAMLRRANVTHGPAKLLGRFVYWIVLLVVIITAADTVGWTAVSQEISKLLSYLPQLLAAVIFFMVGLYIISFLRDVMRGASATLGIGAGRAVSNIIYYLLLVIISLTALDQAGMDTSILTSNLLVIIGSVMLAVAIAYGFASRDVLTNILASFFSRRTIQVGQVIEVNGHRGRVIAISSLSVTLRVSANEQLIIPSKDFINSPVRIIDLT